MSGTLRGWEAGPDGTLVRSTPRALEPVGFMGPDGLKQLQPPTWLIEPYVAEGALIMLAAAANTGKTFLALDWALTLAAESKPVLYLALEGLHGLGPRVHAWEQHHEKHPGSILYGRPGYRLSLLDPRAVGRICDKVRADGPFALTVVDNLGEAFPGDENDARSVGQAVDSLKRIREASGGAVLDLHNFGHGGTRARGHSKLLDAHDTVIYLNPVENGDGLRITSGKERNAERFRPRSIRLAPVGESLVAVPGPALVVSEEVAAALAHGPLTITELSTATGLDRKATQRRVQRLVKLGEIEEVGKKGNAVTYTLTAFAEVA